MKFSIVSPVYRAESILPTLVKRIEEGMLNISSDFEIILVEDGGPDNSWRVIEQLCAKNKNVKGIQLSRNFGQHFAIMAGLEKAKGEWIIVMDCDLQDRPEEFSNLFNKANEGFDLVVAKREVRKDTFFKKTTSKLFTIFYNYMSDNKHDSAVANFGIYNKKVIKEVLKMKDSNKIFPLFINWVGFNKAEVIVNHGERYEGESSYSFIKLISLAFNGIISFSNRPLRLVISFGIFISTISTLMGFLFLYRSFIDEITVIG